MAGVATAVAAVASAIVATTRDAVDLAADEGLTAACFMRAAPAGRRRRHKRRGPRRRYLICDPGTRGTSEKAFHMVPIREQTHPRWNLPTRPESANRVERRMG